MYFATLLVLCGSICICSAYIEPKDPIGSCNDERVSFCIDCYTVSICSEELSLQSNNSAIPAANSFNSISSATSTNTSSIITSVEGYSEDEDTIQTCSSGNACFQTSTYAICESSSKVPSCDCPPEGLTPIPDAYDTQKYILCVDGTGIIVECNENEYYDPETRECGEEKITIPTPTEIPTTIAITCGNEVEFKRVSCTEYVLCVPGDEPNFRECGPGEIFIDNNIPPCGFIYPFSCEGYVEPGYVSDTTDCSLGHFCENEQEMGEVIDCVELNGENYIFDDTKPGCVEDENGDKCTALEDCGICKDSTTRITIDCFSYYQCSPGTGDLPYDPVVKNCPSGSYYDGELTACVLDPPAGCE